MKKIMVTISLLTTIIFSGCSNQITIPTSSTIKVVQKTNAKTKKQSSGKRLYKNRCHKIKKRFANVSNAKKYIRKNNICKNLNKNQLNKVACHLAKNCKVR